MQFILTSDELKEHERDLEKKQKIINDLCQRICNTEPVKWGSSEIKPWGCIRSVNGEWYCDKCPVEIYCKKEKHFSK